jgi:hypothetical protein
MKASTALRAGASLATLALAMWWLGTRISVDATLVALGNTQPLMLAATVPVIIVSHIVRAYRWQLLLQHAVSINVSTLFSGVMIGYAFNTVLTRSGEVLRPWIVSRKTSAPLGILMGSVVTERVIDVCTLVLGVCMAGIFAQPILASIVPSFSVNDVLLKLVLPILFVFVIILVIARSPLGKRFRVLSDVARGISLDAIRQHPLRIVCLTLLLWMLYILPMWMIIEAVLPTSSSSFLDATLLLIAVSIAVTVAPTPGALGVYQGFAQAAAVLILGATSDAGLAFAIVAWLVNYGIAVLVGAACLANEFRTGLRWADVHNARNAES